jgi:hypothetical protein
VIPTLPSDEGNQQRTPREKFAHLEPLGCFTGVTALVLVNISWNQAVVVGWEQPYVYTRLIIRFLFFAAFFWVELFFPNNLILPLGAFTSDITFI